MGYLAFWVIMATIVALIANSRGRAVAPWFLYGLLIWPVALVHILVKPVRRARVEQRAVEQGDMKKCPRCAEMVRAEAVVCRFCGHEFSAVQRRVEPGLR